MQCFCDLELDGMFMKLDVFKGLVDIYSLMFFFLPRKKTSDFLLSFFCFSKLEAPLLRFCLSDSNSFISGVFVSGLISGGGTHLHF